MESFDQRLKNKQVIVIANGIEYRGKLMAVTEDEVYLMTVLGYVNLPVENVAQLYTADEKQRLKDNIVDTTYFDDSLENTD